MALKKDDKKEAYDLYVEVSRRKWMTRTSAQLRQEAKRRGLRADQLDKLKEASDHGSSSSDDSESDSEEEAGLSEKQDVAGEEASTKSSPKGAPSPAGPRASSKVTGRPRGEDEGSSSESSSASSSGSELSSSDEEAIRDLLRGRKKRTGGRTRLRRRGTARTGAKRLRGRVDGPSGSQRASSQGTDDESTDSGGWSPDEDVPLSSLIPGAGSKTKKKSSRSPSGARAGQSGATKRRRGHGLSTLRKADLVLLLAQSDAKWSVRERGILKQ